MEGEMDYLKPLIEETMRHVRKWVAALWKHYGHGVTQWQLLRSPSITFWMECPTCHEILVVQMADPANPVCFGVEATFLRGKCGSRTREQYRAWAADQAGMVVDMAIIVS